MPSRLRLSDRERETLAEIGKRLGRKALAQVACVSRPDTILAWYRRLIPAKFDRAKHRSYPGRPRIPPEVEALVVRFARENSGWGYDRIAGALANLGHDISDQTVGNVLRRHGISPAPKRSQTTTWKDFIASHTAVLSGIDFFTVEVLTWRGLATYYVLFDPAGNTACDAGRVQLALDRGVDATDCSQPDGHRFRSTPGSEVSTA